MTSSKYFLKCLKLLKKIKEEKVRAKIRINFKKGNCLEKDLWTLVNYRNRLESK